MFVRELSRLFPSSWLGLTERAFVASGNRNFYKREGKLQTGIFSQGFSVGIIREEFIVKLQVISASTLHDVARGPCEAFSGSWITHLSVLARGETSSSVRKHSWFFESETIVFLGV